MKALHLRRPSRRWAVVSLIVALVAAAGVGWWIHSSGTSSADNPAYRLVSATTGTIRQSVASTGTIAPAQQDAVNFTVSGKVTRVAVTAGQRVTAGAVLATVDSASLAADLAEAKATLATAQAKVAADNADSATTSTQLTADTAAATAAQSQVAAAQASMSAATLTSPITGVVATVNLTVGEQVGGSSSTGSGSGSGGSGSGGSGAGTGSGVGSGNGSSTSTSSTSGSSSAQFFVISTTSWVVNAAVDSTGVGLIAAGDQAQIIPGSTSSVLYGTIASVGIMATSTSGVASFPVVIDVTGSPPGLHAGDTATVSLIYKQLTDVLTVPTAAVRTLNGKRVVYQVSGGKQVAHDVQVGVSSGGLTEITAGLNEGDQVAVPTATPAGGGASGANRSGANRTGTNRFGGGFGGGGFGGGGGATGGRGTGGGAAPAGTGGPVGPGG
jgi:membrane fusion protein, macrolide-specific efflux system